MIDAGVAQIVATDGVAGAAEVARRAMARAGTLRARVAVLLATPDHRASLPAMIRTVREGTRADHVVGGTVAGTITPHGEIEEEHAVAALVLGGDAEAAPFLVPAAGRSGEAGGEIGELARGASLLVALADPAGVDPGALLGALADAAPGLPLAGGGCAGADGAGAAQFLDDRVERGAVAGLIVRGRLRADVRVSHGCRPLAAPGTITRGTGNVIQEIDGASALETMAQVVAATPGLGDLRRALLAVAVGLSDGDGDYVVRPILQVDPVHGALAVGDVVRAGQRVRFTVREAIGARDDLRATVGAARAAFASPPAAGVYFSCASRGSHLYGAGEVDASVLRHGLGDLPLLGAYTSFELAGPGGAPPRLHMFTGVLALIG